jgi:hypothetical protein
LLCCGYSFIVVVQHCGQCWWLTASTSLYRTPKTPSL